jgi:PLP dependent protein
MTTIAERWAAVRREVDQAALACGRDPASVHIIAVSKKHSAGAVRQALAAGAVDLGENYVQEMISKRAEIETGTAPTPIRWHFIGHLQSNKARMIAGRVAMIHAVDSFELGKEISKRAAQLQPIAVAVNVAEEASKSGTSVADTITLVQHLVKLPNIRVDGLMTMPPPDMDDSQTSAVFARLRQLRDQLQDLTGAAMPVLSMGMSDDFALAIAQGATHVRIGTAIFGARDLATIDATAALR